MSEPNAERLVAEQLLNRPRGIAVEQLYDLLSDIEPERINHAILNLRQAGVLQPFNHGKVAASEAVLYLEDLRLLGTV